MKQTIALIDDDRNILTSISMALEKEGFNVQTYLDGESALIGLSRTPPDLAVIDIKMPKMDGEELLKKLRKKTSLPIIFLTSKDEEVDELLGLKLGADDFVKKSGGFSIKILIERIRVQLRKKNINIDDAKRVVDQLIQHGEVKRGFIGISPFDVTYSLRQQLKLPVADGVIVAKVIQGYPAEKAGMEANDVIVMLGETPILNTGDLSKYLIENRSGEKISVQFYREGKLLTVGLTLVEMPD